MRYHRAVCALVIGVLAMGSLAEAGTIDFRTRGVWIDFDDEPLSETVEWLTIDAQSDLPYLPRLAWTSSGLGIVPNLPAILHPPQISALLDQAVTLRTDGRAISSVTLGNLDHNEHVRIYAGDNFTLAKDLAQVITLTGSKHGDQTHLVDAIDGWNARTITIQPIHQRRPSEITLLQVTATPLPASIWGCLAIGAVLSGSALRRRKRIQ